MLSLTQTAQVDRFAIRFRNLLERLESVRSVDLLVRHEVCEHCEIGTKTEIGERYRNGRAMTWKTICARCRKPWRPIELTDLRTPISRSSSRKLTARPSASSQKPRSDTTGREEQMRELAHLRSIFLPRPRRMGHTEWQGHLVAWFGFLDPRYGTFRGVSEAAIELLPATPLRWTPGSVRGMVERARRICAIRLERAGLWQGPPLGGDGGWRRAWRSPGRGAGRSTARSRCGNRAAVDSSG